MTAMKKTLLQIIQDILSDADSEPINSISDSLEGEQCAAIIEHAFYDIVTREQPEHMELIKLVPASDSEYPTHFYYPENVTDVKHIWYDNTKALTGTGDYVEVCWMEPYEFLKRSDSLDSTDANVQSVVDKNGGTTLKIETDEFPRYWTTFDDYWIIMNAVHSDYDDTLQSSKVRAMGRKYPEFNRFDDEYIPDIDDEYFGYLIAEARSRFFDWYKGGTTTKAEQAARRNKVHIRNDRYRSKRPNNWSNYGRHS